MMLRRKHYLLIGGENSELGMNEFVKARLRAEKGREGLRKGGKEGTEKAGSTQHLAEPEIDSFKVLNEREREKRSY
jgi:hypothetical protein